MKKVFPILLLALLAAFAGAQQVTRVVALPFSTSEAASPYGAGMAAALQRGLNTIDNVYVPPVGDALAVAERLQNADRLSPESLAEAFDAAAVVSGQVEASGNQARILIGLSGPRFPEARDLTVTGPLEDAPQLVTRVVNEVVRALGLSLGGADRAELDAVLAQTPEFSSLLAVAASSLRTQAPNRAQLEAAAQLSPDSSWVLAERARALALAGEPEAALTLAAQATEQAPADAEAWVTRGIITLAAGDQGAALAAFEAALEVNPAHALALAGQGQLLLDTDRARAEAALQAALVSYPRLVDAYLLLASLQDTQGAVRTLRGGAARVPESAVLHEAIVQAAISTGGEAAALDYLRQVLGERPESPPAVYALAAGFSGEAQAEGARALLAQGRERYPESATLAFAEGVLLERQGDLTGAESALRAGLERQPGNLDAVNRLAIVQARQGDLAGAQATLEAVADADPNLHPNLRVNLQVNLQVNLAQIYIQAGQSRAALTLLDELLQDSPEDAQLWTLYGIASGRTGAYSQALDALDRAIALDPDNEDVRRARSVVEQAMNVTQGQEVELSGEASAPFEAGLAALEAGDMGRAASEFARARAAEDSGVAAFYHGFALQLSNQPRQAVTAYERAQEDYPDNSVIANNLGYAYLQIGRLDRALEHITRAIALDDGNARAHMNLGLALFQLGRYADAVGSWERATALDADLEGELSELLETARSRAN